MSVLIDSKKNIFTGNKMLLVVANISITPIYKIFDMVQMVKRRW